MSIVALDPIKLLVLMACGGGFAVAGLWLMFRPKPEGGAAKLELFGLKFEASSAGLLVFLIGSAFLAMPLVVPEREAAAEPETAVTDEPSGGVTGAEGQAAAGDAGTESSVSPAARLIPPRKRATAAEIERNDDYDTANQITVGGSIRGTAAEKSEDWFVVPVEPTLPSLHVKVRGASEQNICSIHFYSAEERAIGNWQYMPKENTVASWELPLDGTAAVFLRVDNPGSNPCTYELFTGREPL